MGGGGGGGGGGERHVEGGPYFVNSEDPFLELRRLGDRATVTFWCAPMIHTNSFLNAVSF